MCSDTRSQPVPLCTIEGKQIGTVTVQFREDDGAANIQLVEYDGPESGIECFCVVEFGPPDGSPTRVLAFDTQYFAPIGDCSLDQHFLHLNPSYCRVEAL